MYLLRVSILFLLAAVPLSPAQSYGQLCLDGRCQLVLQSPIVRQQYPQPQIIYYPPAQNGIVYQTPIAAHPFQQFATEVLSDANAPSGRAAVRVVVGNGCGSGSVVGYYKTGSLILTNAHVAGTRVGRTCDIDVMVDGKRKSLKGTVIMAAYSDKTLTDWAIIYVDDWQEIKPVSLSKDKPSGSHYTKGSPRCVWPQVATDVKTVEVADNSPLWRWRPNSIGGQSGSGVWSDEDNRQYGLLTWSWGGLGAGQQTSEIYRQATEQSTDGPPRIPGLQIPKQTGDVILETGFFQQVGISDLPIWGDNKPPENPTDPLNEADRALFRRLQAEAVATGLNTKEIVDSVISLLRAVNK